MKSQRKLKYLSATYKNRPVIQILWDNVYLHHRHKLAHTTWVYIIKQRVYPTETITGISAADQSYSSSLGCWPIWYVRRRQRGGPRVQRGLGRRGCLLLPRWTGLARQPQAVQLEKRRQKGQVEMGPLPDAGSISASAPFTACWVGPHLSGQESHSFQREMLVNRWEGVRSPSLSTTWRWWTYRWKGRKLLFCSFNWVQEKKSAFLQDRSLKLTGSLVSDILYKI